MGILLAILAACSVCGSGGHLERYGEADFYKLCSWSAAQGYIPALTDKEQRYLWLIAKRESSGRPAARNGQHKGLFQRAEKVHGKASPCPAKQLDWYWDYVKGRYGTPERAYKHLQTRGWQ